MKNFNSLILIFGLTVLGLGLIGCSSDKDSDKASNEAWGIQEPLIIQTGLPEVKLTLFDGGSKGLSSNDSLRFHAHDLRSGQLTLHVKADCTGPDGTYESHESHSPLKELYAFYEFLPPATLVLNPRLDRDLRKCRFEFSVATMRGQTHRFRTPLYPLIVDEPKNPLVILNDHEALTVAANVVPTLYLDSLSRYSVPASAYRQSIYCNHFEAALDVITRPLRMDNITFKPRDSKVSAPQLNQDVCRLIETTEQGQILNMSSLFRFDSRPHQPIINVKLSPNRGNYWKFGLSNLHAEYVLQNQNSQVVEYGLLAPKNIPIHLMLVVPRRGPAGSIQLLGQPFVKSAQLQVLGPKTQSIDQRILFKLGPKQIAKIRFVYHVQNIVCPHGHWSGIISHLDENVSFSIQQYRKLGERDMYYIADEATPNLLFETYYKSTSDPFLESGKFMNFTVPQLNGAFSQCQML